MEATDRFERLMEITEESSPGFTAKWEAWLNALPDPENEPNPRDLLKTEVPFAIRGRGESLEQGRDLAENSDRFESDDDRWYLTVNARQGGGNDECWCDDVEGDEDEHESGCLWENNQELRAHPDHLFDEYEMFDSTYITHFFAVTASDAEVESLQESIRHAFEQKGLVQTGRSVLEGAITPWAAMGNKSSEFMALKRKLREVIKVEQRKLKIDSDLITNDEQLRGVEALTADFGAGEAKALGVRSNGPERFNHEANALESALGWLESSEAEAEIAQRKLHDAETYLPEDSPLRKELLSDRGVGEYTATEKRGRRNVKVRKRYDRGSVLGFAAENSLKRLKGDRDKTLGALTSVVRGNRKRLLESLSKLPELDSTSDELAEQLFSLGWEGNAAPVLPVGLREDIIGS